MKPIEQLEKEFAKAKAAAEKSAEGVDEKIVSLLSYVIHAAFLQYTIGMMQQRESNEERVAKELFGDGSGEALPEVSQEERDSDGWIELNSGSCPIDENVKVELKFRSSQYENIIDYAGGFSWHPKDDGTDIIAYRIVK